MEKGMERYIIAIIYVLYNTDNKTSFLPGKFGRPIVEGRPSMLIKLCYYYYYWYWQWHWHWHRKRHRHYRSSAAAVHENSSFLALKGLRTRIVLMQLLRQILDISCSIIESAQAVGATYSAVNDLTLSRLGVEGIQQASSVVAITAPATNFTGEIFINLMHSTPLSQSLEKT